MSKNEAIKGLVKSNDWEAVSIGEMLSTHVDDFILSLKKVGFTSLEAEAGVVAFCGWVQRHAHKSYQIFSSYNREDILDRLVRCCKLQAEKYDAAA